MFALILFAIWVVLLSISAYSLQKHHNILLEIEDQDRRLKSALVTKTKPGGNYES